MLVVRIDVRLAMHAPITRATKGDVPKRRGQRAWLEPLVSHRPSTQRTTGNRNSCPGHLGPTLQHVARQFQKPLAQQLLSIGEPNQVVRQFVDQLLQCGQQFLAYLLLQKRIFSFRNRLTSTVVCVVFMGTTLGWGYWIAWSISV